MFSAAIIHQQNKQNRKMGAENFISTEIKVKQFQKVTMEYLKKIIDYVFHGM